MQQTKINLFLNTLLIILILIITSTGIYMSLYHHGGNMFGVRLAHLHEWLGYVLAVLVVVHLILHFKMFKRQICNCLENKNFRIASVSIAIFLALFFFVYPFLFTSNDQNARVKSIHRQKNYQNGYGIKSSRMYNESNYHGYRHSK